MDIGCPGALLLVSGRAVRMCSAEEGCWCGQSIQGLSFEVYPFILFHLAEAPSLFCFGWTIAKTLSSIEL